MRRQRPGLLPAGRSRPAVHLRPAARRAPSGAEVRRQVPARAAVARRRSAGRVFPAPVRPRAAPPGQGQVRQLGWLGGLGWRRCRGLLDTGLPEHGEHQAEGEQEEHPGSRGHDSLNRPVPQRGVNRVHDVGRADDDHHQDDDQPRVPPRPPPGVSQHDCRDARDDEYRVEQPGVDPGEPRRHPGLQDDRVHSGIRQHERARSHGQDHDQDRQVQEQAGPVAARCGNWTFIGMPIQTLPEGRFGE